LKNFVLLFTVLLFSGCGSAIELSSTWRQQQIVVDGENADWVAMPSHAEKTKFTVSVSNDNEFAYICLTSHEPRVHMQMMMSGFTVWFDRNGGSDKTFGIKFPLGRQAGAMPPMMDREKMNDPETMRQLSDGALSEFEILGPNESDRYRLSVTSGGGIQAKLGRSKQGQMVYELRVPLTKSPVHKYAINVLPSARIGVGFETGKMEKGKRDRGGEHGTPGGSGDGEPPMGGGRGGGMAGPPGGGRSGGPPESVLQTEAIDLWFSVQLSKETQLTK
jgi:hypothetical protein